MFVYQRKSYEEKWAVELSYNGVAQKPLLRPYIMVQIRHRDLCRAGQKCVEDVWSSQKTMTQTIRHVFALIT